MLTRAFELATAAALASRGLRPEVVETSTGWRVKCWRGGKPSGEPWLLLHGLGATAATYLPLLPHLQSECELLVPELSTLGGTRGPQPALGIAGAAEVLTELLTRFFSGKQATLCGVSLGGWMAVRLALAHPELAARLLLIVPGGYRDQDWERIGRMVRVETYRDSAAIWQALFAHPPRLLRLGRPLLYLAYRSEAVRAALGTFQEADAFGDTDLARLDMPVGLIWGAEDRLFLREAGERMARALPNAHFQAIADAGHGVQWERPKAFFAAVRSFRDAHPLS